MPPTNIERARNDILEMFGENYWDISFTEDGRKALLDLIEQSLGNYFREIEPLNSGGRDLWSGPDLKEMPHFILGYVVAQMAIALKKLSATNDADAATVKLIGQSVMKDAKTEENCAYMLGSYNKKVVHPAATPICNGVKGKN